MNHQEEIGATIAGCISMRLPMTVLAPQLWENSHLKRRRAWKEESKSEEGRHFRHVWMTQNPRRNSGEGNKQSGRKTQVLGRAGLRFT
jgi:hypothetical protein